MFFKKKNPDKQAFDEIWTTKVTPFLRRQADIADQDISNLADILERNDELRSGVAILLSSQSLQSFIHGGTVTALREKLKNVGIEIDNEVLE